MAKHAHRSARPPDHAQNPDVAYRTTVAACVLLTILLASLIAVLLTRARLAALVRDLHADQASPSPTSLVTLTLLLVIPLLSAVAGYVLIWRIIHFIRLILYLRAVHVLARSELRRRIPLAMAGIEPLACQVDASGALVPDTQRSLHEWARRGSSAILLGSSGSGKTTSLLQLAVSLTTLRAAVRISLHRQRLPILLQLGTDGGSSNGSLASLCARQTAGLATPGLRTQLPRWLAAGRLLILCDGLEDASPQQVHALATQYVSAGAPARRQTQIIMACDLNRYTGTLAPTIGTLPRLLLTELAPVQIVAATARAARRSGQRRHTNADMLVAHNLETSVVNPLGLASLCRVIRAGEPLPIGRAALLQAGCAAASTGTTSTTGTDAHTTDDELRRVLGDFAASLRPTGQRWLALGVSQTPGEALWRWLADHDASTASHPNELAAAALSVGLLVCTADGKRLGFATRALEESYAAEHLRARWCEDAVLDTRVRDDCWMASVVLWAGLPNAGGDVAALLLRSVEAPQASDAPAPAAAPEQPEQRARTIALAVAAACERAAFLIATEEVADGDGRGAHTTQAHLREVLDVAHRFLAASGYVALAEAFGRLDRLIGPEYIAQVSRIVQRRTLDRFVRAQLVTLLGVMSSAPALLLLESLLTEPDPTVRQAVTQAFLLGSETTQLVLERATASSDERIRLRAAEIAQAARTLA